MTATSPPSPPPTAGRHRAPDLDAYGGALADAIPRIAADLHPAVVAAAARPDATDLHLARETELHRLIGEALAHPLATAALAEFYADLHADLLDAYGDHLAAGRLRLLGLKGEDGGVRVEPPTGTNTVVPFRR